MRYSQDALLKEFGEDFELLESQAELHLTPKGIEQRFLYCSLRKRA
jgi:hypothetical protein